MRPFQFWPRWALDAVHAVLMRMPIAIMNDTLTQVMVERWARDTYELEEDSSVPAHPVAPVKGVN
jgi:hypothetical protein